LKDTLFIINPVSGRGNSLHRWAEIRRELVRLGLDFDEYITKGAGDATNITSKALMEGARRVIAVGGDGTLSEVVNGYLGDSGQAVNPDAVVGLLASGTGSDFRRSLRIEHGRDQIDALLNSHVRSIDAVRATFIQKKEERERASLSICHRSGLAEMWWLW